MPQLWLFCPDDFCRLALWRPLQDDAHIFCLPGQIADEILGVLNLTEAILRQFDFTKFEVNLSTRPEKAVGSDEIWEKATTALREALDRKGWEYGIDEGGGAFYGPKIDIKIEDAIGRRWQCSTIQVRTCGFGNLATRVRRWDDGGPCRLSRRGTTKGTIKVDTHSFHLASKVGVGT